MPAMSVMLLAPLLRCGCFQCYISLVVCASPHFEQVALAGGLFRTVSHTPFVSLGNAAPATYPNSLSRKSSRVVGRASSTHVPVLYTNTVQSRMWPWSYSVVRDCYLRKPWIMAMPSDSSRTYHAMISMMLGAVLLLLSLRVAICSTLRVGAVSRANVLVPVKCGPWRF